jgi:hypothetical protein
MQVNYSDGQIFVKFEDGSFVLQPCSREQASQIMMLEDKDEILKILNPNLEKELKAVEEAHSKNAFWNNFKDDRFYLKEDKLYHKDIPLSIPKVLADTIQALIIEGNEEELSKLEKFWMWSSLIKNAESRESLYPFLIKQKIQLTDDGEMLTYRRVVSTEETNVDLVKFVTQTYLKKRTAKKSTDVTVWGNNNKSGEYTLTPDTPVGYYEVGNLKEIYHNLEEMEGNTFTDNHTKTEVYKIGVESRMKWSQADWNTYNTCSRGYHSSGVKFAYSGFGDTPLLCIVNPKDVVACVEGSSKMRSVAFTPVAVLNEDCEWQDDKEIHNVISEQYKAKIETLREELAKGEFKEWENGHTILEEIPEVSFNTIVQKVINNVSLKDRLIKL